MGHSGNAKGFKLGMGIQREMSENRLRDEAIQSKLIIESLKREVWFQSTGSESMP